MAYSVSYAQHNDIGHPGRNTVAASAPSSHYQWNADKEEWELCLGPEQYEAVPQFELYGSQQSQQSVEGGQHAEAGGNFAATITEIEERCKNTSVVMCPPDGGETSKAFEAILDTGATWNFISERQLHKLGLANRLKKDIRFIVKNGQGKQTQATGYVMLRHAEFNRRNNTYITTFNTEPSQFVVMKELSHPCIIGRRESITQILLHYISTLPKDLRERIQKHHENLADTPEVVECGELNVHDDGQKKLSRKERQALDSAQSQAAQQERAERTALEVERRLRISQGYTDAYYDQYYCGYFAADGGYYRRL